MTTAANTRLTGFVMPVGNGAVGKTSVARVLDSLIRGGITKKEILEQVRKTHNLEYEFITTKQKYGNQQFNITFQILIPPGQKESEGDLTGRSFERIIDIYKSSIRRVDVVLFTYNMTSKGSFHDLVYWVDGVGELINDATHFILLGTHLDRVEDREVADDEIEDGMAYLRSEILNMRPTWKANCARLEVSNLTGENLQSLLYFLAGSVISSRKIIP